METIITKRYSITFDDVYENGIMVASFIVKFPDCKGIMNIEFDYKEDSTISSYCVLNQKEITECEHVLCHDIADLLTFELTEACKMLLKLANVKSY